MLSTFDFAAVGGRFESIVSDARLRREAPATLWADPALLALFGGAVTGSTSMADSAAAFEALLYAVGDCGVATSTIIHHCVCSIVGEYAPPALRERFLANMLSTPCSVAMTEPHGGSAAFDMRTRLEVTPRGLLLVGEKWHITNAPTASAYVVFAHDTRYDAPSAVFVDRTLPGVQCDPLQPSGMRSASIGRLRFEAPIDPACVLGQGGDGVTIFQSATVREKVLIAFAVSGLMGRVLDDMMAYVQTRGLGQHQYVRGRITSMKIGLEATRGLGRAALDRLVRGEEASLEAAIAKLHAAEFAIEASLHAMKLMGSHGYADGGLADLLLGSVGASLGGGSEEAQREIIYKQLLIRHRRAAAKAARSARVSHGA